MLNCPRCGESNPDLLEYQGRGRYYCVGCDTVWIPGDDLRLPVIEPRRRRDLE